jgi:hypothetical protein
MIDGTVEDDITMQSVAVQSDRVRPSLQSVCWSPRAAARRSVRERRPLRLERGAAMTEAVGR